MVTVFAILLIVINLSKLLILVVNKIAPEEQPTPVAAKPTGPTIDVVTMEIISQTGFKLTGGAGVVKSVERV